MAEDVVTRGGRVQETIQIVRDHGGIVAAASSIVDRSGGTLPDFGCPFVSLVQMNVETFEADKLAAFDPRRHARDQARQQISLTSLSNHHRYLA